MIAKAKSFETGNLPHLLYDTNLPWYICALAAVSAPVIALSVVPKSLNHCLVATKRTASFQHYEKVRMVRSLSMILLGLTITLINFEVFVPMQSTKAWVNFASLYNDCKTAHVRASLFLDRRPA